LYTKNTRVNVRCLFLGNVKEKLKEYYRTVKEIELLEKEVSRLKDILDNYKKFKLNADIASLPFNSIKADSFPKSYIEEQIEYKYKVLENKIEGKEREILDLKCQISEIETFINDLPDYEQKLLNLIYKQKKSYREIAFALNESKSNIAKKHDSVLKQLNNLKLSNGRRLVDKK